MFKKEAAENNAKTVETVIGPSVKVEGDFIGDGDLIVEGMVVGTLKTKNNLKIGKNSIVKAEVSARNAFISGQVKGNVIIKEKLEITGSGVIIGNVKAALLAMEAGAIVNGQVTMPTENSSVHSDKNLNKQKKVEETEDQGQSKEK